MRPLLFPVRTHHEETKMCKCSCGGEAEGRPSGQRARSFGFKANGVGAPVFAHVYRHMVVLVVFQLQLLTLLKLWPSPLIKAPKFQANLCGGIAIRAAVIKNAPIK